MSLQIQAINVQVFIRALDITPLFCKFEPRRLGFGIARLCTPLDLTAAHNLARHLLNETMLSIPTESLLGNTVTALIPAQ
jgi:hypothetical protein